MSKKNDAPSTTDVFHNDAPEENPQIDFWSDIPESDHIFTFQANFNTSSNRIELLSDQEENSGLDEHPSREALRELLQGLFTGKYK
jgi:hypothetical protein